MIVFQAIGTRHGLNVSTTRNAGNVYLLVLSSWKLNIAENPIAVMGL